MNQKTPTVPEHVMPTPTHGGEAPRPPEGAKRKSGKGWIWLLLLIVAAAAAYYYWPKGSPAEAGTAPSGGGGAGKKKGGGGLAPVVAVKVTRGNIGVYEDDPGAVTPIYTVLERSRVDGELMAVNYKEGDIVEKGQSLLEIDKRPYQVALETAEGQRARDEAMLDNAKVDLRRYQTLLAQNAIPAQQLDTQKALVAQYTGTVQIDQAAIDSAKLNIVYCDIRAQITGRIGLRLVDPGNIVHASDQTGLVVITQMEPISVIFPVEARKLPPIATRFNAGQKLTVEAWDPDGNRKLSVGTLATMDNQIDPSTATLKLRAMFDNKDNALYPNQMVNTRLLVEEKRGVVLLPTAAIQLGATSRKYVWLLKPDSTVTVRDITTGTSEGDQTEITSGLDAGENVIMTGVDKLNEGSKVNVAGGDGGPGGGKKGSGGRRGAADQSGTAPAADAQQGKGGKGRGGKSGGQHQ
ncbi:multidrug efflux system, subunit A [Candidatus Sulfopaludibacter sp. SbA3]|nr:multidrug efflux system, subunit A [Candidatus Sulfopaludibacter sp. SbA3]